jgi:hypothetical protein
MKEEEENKGSILLKNIQETVCKAMSVNSIKHSGSTRKDQKGWDTIFRRKEKQMLTILVCY